MKRYRIMWSTHEHYETYIESEVDLRDATQELLHAIVDDRLNADQVNMANSHEPFVAELVGERLEAQEQVAATGTALAKIMHNVTYEYPGYIRVDFPDRSGKFWTIGINQDGNPPTDWRGQLNKQNGAATGEAFTLHGVSPNDSPEDVAMRIMMAIGSAEMGVDR